MTTLLDQLAALPDDDIRTDWRSYAYLSLREWLPTVRARRFRILIEEGLPHLDYEGVGSGHPVLRDYWLLRRHAHALGVALAGEHKVWWSFASGASDVPPAINDVPVSAADPDTFACAWCGGPALVIDDRAIAWCPTHDPEETR